MSQTIKKNIDHHQSDADDQSSTSPELASENSTTPTHSESSQMLEKRFQHQTIEPEIVKLWEDYKIGRPRFNSSHNSDTTHTNLNSSDHTTPSTANTTPTPASNPTKKPFSVLMPPPNANASLHAGHAMYVIQDIMVRFKRMQGHPTVWFPGTDHAGFESQFVYEKHLKKQGQSRFQFDRETLYQNISQFVKDNSGLIIKQMKRLGFSADWDRTTFMLDEKVVDIVLNTFMQLEKEGLIYRDAYIVNYCPKLGTTFSDIEVEYKDQKTPLYHIKYKFSDGEPRIINTAKKQQEIHNITVATVRPETIFADVAIAIHPDDPRAKDLVGEMVLNPLTHEPLPIIADHDVDPDFGTGLLKITPAHDQTDFTIGRRHKLPLRQTIDTFGKIDLSWWNPPEEPLKSRAEQLQSQFQGLSIFHGRPAVVKLLQAENSIDHVDEKYQNRVAVSYKGNHPIEPLPYPNWFLKMKDLAELGKQAVDSQEVKIIPNRFKKQYFNWLNNIRDWPISRQIVWGIRMPVWYSAQENPDIFVSFLVDGNRHNLTIGEAQEQGFSIAQIKQGLQTLTAPVNSRYRVSKTDPGSDYLQETDTFDTWFSSGQWPLTVTNYPDGDDFKKFFPTSMLDSMWDILFFWIARMIMLSKYLTRSPQNPQGLAPFKTVYLHSMVTDSKGAKMSKSKGNVVNPLNIVDRFGADALRISLVAGSSPGNPIALSEPKVKGYRNFANKIWNIGRFIQLAAADLSPDKITFPQNHTDKLTSKDQVILDKLEGIVAETTTNLENYRFSDAALTLYNFIWNEFANTYLEENKDRTDKDVYLSVVAKVYFTSLKLLHPFMPFVTEAVWQRLSGINPYSTTNSNENGGDLLALSSWK